MLCSIPRFPHLCLGNQPAPRVCDNQSLIFPLKSLMVFDKASIFLFSGPSKFSPLDDGYISLGRTKGAPSTSKSPPRLTVAQESGKSQSSFRLSCPFTNTTGVSQWSLARAKGQEKSECPHPKPSLPILMQSPPQGPEHRLATFFMAAPSLCWASRWSFLILDPLLFLPWAHSCQSQMFVPFGFCSPILSLNAPPSSCLANCLVFLLTDF